MGMRRRIAPASRPTPARARTITRRPLRPTTNTTMGSSAITFQDLILALQQYWARKGCIVVQPTDLEVGAGTSNRHTFLRALGPEPWKVAYVEPCRRPTDDV